MLRLLANLITRTIYDMNLKVRSKFSNVNLRKLYKPYHNPIGLRVHLLQSSQKQMICQETTA